MFTANATSRSTRWDCACAIRSINSDFVIGPLSHRRPRHVRGWSCRRGRSGAKQASAGSDEKIADGACIIQTESAPSLQYLDRFGKQPLLLGRSSRRAAHALAVRTGPQPFPDRGPIDRAVLAQAVAAIDRNHETDMPATTVMTYPQTVQPLEQFDSGFIERSACPCPSDGCQYFVGFSRPPQGVVDLSHAVVLGNEERTHPLYPFIAPAPRFNVIDGPRAMRPVPIPPGFGEHSGPRKRVELAGREPRTLTHVVLKQHGCGGRAHTAPRIRTTFGASVAVTKRHHCAMIGRRRSSRSVRT